jgi:predicted metalloprotease
VRAFQDGYANGALICKPYLDSPTESTLMPFMTEEDYQTGGNLPYDDLVTLVQQSLDAFWPGLLTANGIDFTPPTLTSYPHDGPYPPCDGKTDEDYSRAAFYCESTGEVMFDGGLAIGLHDSIGDFAAGYLVAVGYADAVQTALGSTFTGAKRSLYNDCITGVWTRALFPDVATADSGQISPGDLDEAVRAALAVGDEDDDTDRNGTAFDKIEAYRIGVLNGLEACNTDYGS